MAETQHKNRGRASAAHDDKTTGGASNAGTDGGSPAERAQTPAEDDTAKAAENREAATKARTTNAGTAPIEPPGSDRRPPVEGIRHLSTSPVAAAASQRSLIGQGHLGLVDDEGNDIDPSSIFDLGDGTKTYAVVTKRVHEKFVQANSSTPITRLLFPEGARIPRDRAQAFLDAKAAEDENPLTEAPGNERHAAIPGAAGQREQAAKLDDGSPEGAEGADSK